MVNTTLFLVLDTAGLTSQRVVLCTGTTTDFYVVGSFWLQFDNGTSKLYQSAVGAQLPGNGGNRIYVEEAVVLQQLLMRKATYMDATEDRGGHS